MCAGSSMFGMSFICNHFFQDDAEIYWARERVLEKINTISTHYLPVLYRNWGLMAQSVGHIFMVYLKSTRYEPW